MPACDHNSMQVNLLQYRFLMAGWAWEEDGRPNRFEIQQETFRSC